MLELNEISLLVGAKFSCATSIGPIELELSEAKELPRGNRPAQFRTPLSLTFTGPVQLMLEQDNYWLEHPSIGRHMWLVVPVQPPLSEMGAHQEKRYYEVLFN